MNETVVEFKCDRCGSMHAPSITDDFKKGIKKVICYCGKEYIYNLSTSIKFNEPPKTLTGTIVGHHIS